MSETTTTTIEHPDGTKVTTVTVHAPLPAAADGNPVEFEELRKCDTTSKLHEHAKAAAASWAELASPIDAVPSEPEASVLGLEHSKLLQEAGATYVEFADTGFKEGDVLVVVDMQNDFCPAAVHTLTRTHRGDPFFLLLEA